MRQAIIPVLIVLLVLGLLSGCSKAPQKKIHSVTPTIQVVDPAPDVAKEPTHNQSVLSESSSEELSDSSTSSA